MLSSCTPLQTRRRGNCARGGGSALDQPGDVCRREIEIGYIGDIRRHLDVARSERRMCVKEDAIDEHVDRSTRGRTSRCAVARATAIEIRQDDARRAELARETHWNVLAESAVDELPAIDSDRLEDERNRYARADRLREVAVIERHAHACVQISRDGTEWDRK